METDLIEHCEFGLLSPSHSVLRKSVIFPVQLASLGGGRRGRDARRPLGFPAARHEAVIGGGGGGVVSVVQRAVGEGGLGRIKRFSCDLLGW